MNPEVSGEQHLRRQLLNIHILRDTFCKEEEAWVEDVRRQEEAARWAKAVSLSRLGQWDTMGLSGEEKVQLKGCVGPWESATDDSTLHYNQNQIKLYLYTQQWHATSQRASRRPTDQHPKHNLKP